MTMRLEVALEGEYDEIMKVIYYAREIGVKDEKLEEH